MLSEDMNLLMSVFYVIGIVVSLKLISQFLAYMCFGSICCGRQRIENDSSRSIPEDSTSESDLSNLERGLQYKGLEPITISKFPLKKFKDAEFCASAENIQCTICLTEYNKEDVLRILPSCGHSFHANCVDVWLKLRSTCPVCRKSVCNFPEDEHLMQPMCRSSARYHHSGRPLTTYPSHNMASGHGFSQ